MDVDTDGQRLATRAPDKDIMDTTLDGAQEPLNNGRAPEVPADRSAPAIATKDTAAAASEPILERPREGGDDVAQESPKLMRKTPH